MPTGTDNFNRANGAMGGSTFSDGVNTWTQAVAAWNINTNVAEASTNDGASIYTSTSGLMTDGTATVKVNVSNRECGVWWRFNPVSTGTGYVAFAHDTAIYLFRYDPGFTNLGSAVITPANNMVLGITVTGTTIEATLDGVTKVSVTDSTYTSGYTGLYANAAPGGSECYFEDFTFTGTAASSSIAAPAVGSKLFSGLSRGLIR